MDIVIILQSMVCYIWEDWYNQGGEGYGISFSTYGGGYIHHCLIENNVVVNVRHSIVVQYDTEYNVFGYNYTANGRGTYVDDLGIHHRLDEEDFDFHGQGSNGKNLVEGNNCEYFSIDTEHGNNGMLNTLMRNSISDFHIQGSALEPQYHQNIVGCKLDHVSVNPMYDVAIANNILLVEYTENGGYNNMPSSQASYYCDSKPGFMPSDNWPYDPGTANPAKSRYHSSSGFSAVPAGWDHYSFEEPYSLDCYYYHSPDSILR